MILSLPLFVFFFVVLSAEGWDWKTERSSSITNTRKPVLQENLLMRAGWRRSGCTHDPTCPAHSRVGGLWGMTGNFLCPPCSHEPIFSPGSTAGCRSGSGLVTCKELLKGISPGGLLCLSCSVGLALVWWQTVSALAQSWSLVGILVSIMEMPVSVRGLMSWGGLCIVAVPRYQRSQQCWQFSTTHFLSLNFVS